MRQMTTRRPYLIRAFFDWILDNDMTPYISVDADYEGVSIPREFVMDGEIVLNLSPTAIRNLDLGLEHVTFDARFSGRPHHIVVPVRAVYAIYAQENGEGMAFGFKRRPDDELGDTMQGPTISGDDNTPPERPSGKPDLKIVK